MAQTARPTTAQTRLAFRLRGRRSVRTAHDGQHGLTARNRLVHTAAMSRRRFIHAVLAFFLLFAQADAVLHVVSHLTDAGTRSSQTDKQLPHSQACEKCLAVAPLDGALPATALITGVTALAPADSAPSPVTFYSRPAPAYASRAPPVLV